MNVVSAAFIYTDVKKIITDKQGIAALSIPSDNAEEIQLETSSVRWVSGIYLLSQFPHVFVVTR